MHSRKVLRCVQFVLLCVHGRTEPGQLSLGTMGGGMADLWRLHFIMVALSD